MLITLLLLTAPTQLNTCGDYMKAGETHRAHYLDGMENGYLSGQFVYYRVLMEHQLAGENSEHVAKVLDRITKDTHKAFSVEDMDKELLRFCKLDKGGKFMLFLVYITVVRNMSGGTNEEFMRDVRVLFDITYGDKEKKGTDI